MLFRKNITQAGYYLVYRFDRAEVGSDYPPGFEVRGVDRGCGCRYYHDGPVADSGSGYPYCPAGSDYPYCLAGSDFRAAADFADCRAGLAAGCDYRLAFDRVVVADYPGGPAVADLGVVCSFVCVFGMPFR